MSGVGAERGHEGVVAGSDRLVSLEMSHVSAVY